MGTDISPGLDGTNVLSAPRIRKVSKWLKVELCSCEAAYVENHIMEITLDIFLYSEEFCRKSESRMAFFHGAAMGLSWVLLVGCNMGVSWECNEQLAGGLDAHDQQIQSFINDFHVHHHGNA